MKITRRENFLLRRALDKASSPAEADMAAKALIASLRARGISSYDIVPADAQERPQSPPDASTAPPPAAHNEPWQSAAAQAQAWQNFYAGAANMTPEQQAAWANMQAQAQAQAQAQPQYTWSADNIPEHPPGPKPSWFMRLLAWLRKIV